MKSKYKKKCLDKIEVFKKDSLKLVDISPCKCTEFDKCLCKIKVPKCEQIFYSIKELQGKWESGVLTLRQRREI